MTRVLAVFEPSARGRAALAHARRLAAGPGDRLIVGAVVPYEPVTVGCVTSRASAVRWNQAMCEVAEERLAEAAGILGSPPDVDYEVAQGPEDEAIAGLAGRVAATTVVLPAPGRGRLRRRRSAGLIARLQRRGSWELRLGPDPATPLGADTGHGR